MQSDADNNNIQEEIQEYEKQCQQWLSKYNDLAKIYRILNSTIQMIISFGAALTAFTIIYPDIPKLIPAIISFLVVLATGLSNYYQFDRVSIGYQKTADAMMDEMNYFHAGVSNYKGLHPKDALEQFMKTINAIKNGRLTVWNTTSSK